MLMTRTPDLSWDEGCGRRGSGSGKASQTRRDEGAQMLLCVCTRTRFILKLMECDG